MSQFFPSVCTRIHRARANVLAEVLESSQTTARKIVCKAAKGSLNAEPAPQAVVPVAERLAWIHLAPRGLLALRLDPAAQPHAQLLATLIVALKLLYGLDGRPRRLPDSVPPPPPDWMTWAAQAVARAPQPSSLSLKPAEVRAKVLRLGCPPRTCHLQYPCQQCY